MRFTGRLVTPNVTPAPSSPTVGEMYYDTGTSTLYWWDGSVWVSTRGSGIPLVSTLPASPTLGDVNHYRVGSGASAIVWSFRYTNNDVTYPWEFIGGPPLISLQTQAESTSVAPHNVYANLADGAVGVTVPLAGVYDADFHAYLIAATANSAYISIKYGAAEAVDLDGILATSSNIYTDLRHRLAIPVTAAATAVTLRFKAIAGTAVTFGRRNLAITPRRVTR
jgi:hypothetical protein